jgi:hypothetical protein
VALLEKLKEDLKQALKKGEQARVSAIRLVLSDINYAEIAKGGPLDDASILEVFARQARRHRESIEAFTKGNRADLVAIEEKELAVLVSYLPQQVSADEIKTAAQRLIAEIGARGPGDKGKVMGKLMAQFKGKAEGSTVNTIVTELLAGL